MKINCEIIEDLLPLYVDGAASEESQKLIQEHTKECENCRRLLEEMKKEAQLPDGNQNSRRQTEAAGAIKQVRRKIRRKRIAAVIAAITATALCALLIFGRWQEWYYQSQTGITQEESGLYVENNVLHWTRMKGYSMGTVIAPNQTEEFVYIYQSPYMKSSEYLNSISAEDITRDFAEQHNLDPDEYHGETAGLAGLEKVYYVPPEAVEEARNLWNYDSENDEDGSVGEERTKALEEKCTLLWSWEGTSAKEEARSLSESAGSASDNADETNSTKTTAMRGEIPAGSRPDKNGNFVSYDGSTYSPDGSWAIPEGGRTDSQGRIYNENGELMYGGAAAGSVG